MTDHDALILGAGPAGSSAAYFLAKAGWNVGIVERAAFPRRKVCGEFISSPSWPLLQQMGIGEAYLAAAGPAIREVGVFSQRTTVTSAMPQGDAGGGWGRALSRNLLDEMLLEAARKEGATVYQPWKVLSVENREDAKVCFIRSAEDSMEIRAPVLIAAYGSWEVGTLPSQPAKSNEASDLLAFKAFFLNSRLKPDLMPLLSFPGGYGGMATSDSGVVGLSCCIRRDVLKAIRRTHRLPTAAESVLRHICETTSGVSQALEGATLSAATLAAGPIRPGVRTRYANGIFRVGNAAGEAHPIIAEGISMAMQSGALLANGLQHCSPNENLDRVGANYSKLWIKHFGPRIRAAGLYSRLAMNPVAGAVLAPLVQALPRLLTLGATFSGKTKDLALSS